MLDVHKALSKCGMIGLQGYLLSHERELVTLAMRVTKGNCEKAAKLLGVNRTTLVEKRKRFGMPLEKKVKR